jgi:uncharacterized protein (DUF4415 family)
MRPSKEERMRKLDNIKDEEIDYTDIPELDDTFWDSAVIVSPERKKPVTLRLDADVLSWFQSGGKGYQTRINAVLRSYVDAHRNNVS